MYQQPEQEMRVVRDVVAEMKALKEENAKLKKQVEELRTETEPCLTKQQLREYIRDGEADKVLAEFERYNFESGKLKRILATRQTIMDGLRKQVDNQTAREEIEKVEKDNEKLWKMMEDTHWDFSKLKSQNEKLQDKVNRMYRRPSAGSCLIIENLEKQNAKLKLNCAMNSDAWEKGFEQGRAKAQSELNDAQQGETEKTEIIKTLVCSIVSSGVMDDGEFKVITNSGWGFTKGERDAFSNILSEMNDDDWNEDDHETKLGYTNGVLELNCV